MFMPPKQFDSKHHALVEAVAARENRFERRVQLLDAKLGEITQPPEVNSQHRHFLITHHAGRGDHCAVATEHQNQIDTCGKFLGLHLLNCAAGLLSDSVALDFGATQESDSTLSKPDCQLANGLKCVRMVWLENYADTFYGRDRHRASRKTASYVLGD